MVNFANVRSADTNGLIYDQLSDDVDLIAVPPPVTKDTTICIGDVAILSAISQSSYDSLHWYADPISNQILQTGANYIDAFETDTTIWVANVGGPFAVEDSLFTTDSFDRSWNGIMVDLIAKESIVLDSLSLPFTLTGSQYLVLRSKQGSYQGHEGSPQSWTLWDSIPINVVSSVPNTFQTVVHRPYAMQAGDTLGLYLALYPESNRIRYQGESTETIIESSGLTIRTGTGISHIFGNTFYPRQINAEFFYTRYRGYCESRPVL